MTSGQSSGLTNPLVRISANRYSVHFSSAHDLYYVIETETDSGRGRVVYAHAWRMCAQYLASRHESLAQGAEAETASDIQNLTALTQRNALFPCPATEAAPRRPFGNGPLVIRNRLLRSRSRRLPQPGESHLRWASRLLRRSRRRLTRLLPHSLRGHNLRPGRDLRTLIES